MPYGYMGKILHVDLSKRTFEIETPDETFYRRYMGGKGFTGYYLNQIVRPGAVDPLGPENVLVFATGVVGGAPGPGFNRNTVAAKSPLTDGWGESEAGGYWGPELKFAGFDAIVVKGQASSPVYLWIHDGEVEIRPADHLWGLETAPAQAAIREELGDERIRINLIGPGAENMVRYACIVNELRHFNGRSGLGAVMGSKKLKAIAVRGHGKVEVKDPERLTQLAREFARQVADKSSTATLQKHGTPGMTGALNAAGLLPTRNFTSGMFEKASDIDFDAFEKFQTGNGTCWACPVRCKRHVKMVDERYSLDERYGGPEYETIAGFGSNCGVSDMATVIKANELCSRYTLDTISTSGTIAFAMECFEKGLITEEDTGGLKLTFGNAEVIIPLVEMIAKRQGFGNLLAEGSLRAAKQIGKGAERYAMQVKGQELAMHEPRGKYAVAIGTAISDSGADHIMGPHDASFTSRDSEALKELAPMGIIEPVELFDLGWKKAQLYYYTENIYTLWKVMGVCNFPWAPRTWQPLTNFVEMCRAITGWDVSLFELVKVAERAAAMGRMFNARIGYGREMDHLPSRFYEPLNGGILKGRGLPSQGFESALSLVYQMKCWDPVTAKPTTAKLLELDLDWLASLDHRNM